VNRADILQRQGKYPPIPGESDLLGLEVSGVVEDVAPDTSGFPVQKGQNVMALLSGGGYAEYVAVDRQLCMAVPEGMSFTSAASIPEAWLTAYQLLRILADCHDGDSVLVHAAASGVGLAAIQLAKAMGAKQIIAVAGDDTKLESCKDIGATDVINYKAISSLSEEVLRLTKGTGVSIILDPIGASNFEENKRSCDTDARWIYFGSMGGSIIKSDHIDMSPLLRKRVSLLFTTLRSRDINYRRNLVGRFSKEFLPQFTTNKLKAVVDSVFKLQDVQMAHQRMEANKNTGKIVLEL